MLNNPNEWHNIEEEKKDNVGKQATNQSVPSAKPFDFNAFVKQNEKIIKIVAILLAVLFIVIFAILMKLNSSSSNVPVGTMDSSELAREFYEKASEGETMAVVDVNLADDATTNLVQSPQTQSGYPIVAQPGIVQNNDVGVLVASKQISTTDKYDYNKNAMAQASRNETVIVSVGDAGRANPFLPFVDKKPVGYGGYSGYGSPEFDLIEPPSMVTPDEDAVQLLEATISGIMYDYKNPSAIVNINGQDQLVRKRDKIYGYTVLDITRDKVVIRSGSNIFRASVGQSISSEGVNINEVSNLRNKFGGAYRPTNRNVIEINSNYGS